MVMLVAAIALGINGGATADEAHPGYRLAQATQAEANPKSVKNQRKIVGEQFDPASTAVKTARKRGRLPDLTTMCDVQPPCPMNCREDIKKNICIENTTP